MMTLFSTSIEAKWLDKKSEGWAWYQDFEVVDETNTIKEAETAKQALQGYKDELEECLSLALINSYS